MNADVLLDLVTPSRNQVDYLRACVACVELLGLRVRHHVQDGASTDGTLEFLRARGTPFESAHDGGLYPALNRALARTTAPLAGWLNCDDLLAPWLVPVLDAALRAHPDADIIYGDAVELRGDRVAVVANPPEHVLAAFLETGGILAQPAVFFRPSLLQALGGLDTRYRLLADHDLFIRAWLAGARFVHVPELLAVQRMVPGQLMEKHAAAAAVERADIFRTHGLYAAHAGVDAAGRRLQAALHRARLAAITARTAWPRARVSNVIRMDTSAVLRTLVTSSSGRRYARPGPAWSTLFPEAPW